MADMIVQPRIGSEKRPGLLSVGASAMIELPPIQTETVVMTSNLEDSALLQTLLAIYDPKTLASLLNEISPGQWTAARLKRLLAAEAALELTAPEYQALSDLLPRPPAHHGDYDFRFVDLFAGIGGIRKGFEAVGGECVFTSEWNKFAVRTYKANHYCEAMNRCGCPLIIYRT